MVPPTIEWQDGKVRIIDQTRLPGELVFRIIEDYQDIAEAIKTLQVRGAPAIGIAGAFGVVMGIQNSMTTTYGEFLAELDGIIGVLRNTRPTAANLFWALERMRQVVLDNPKETVPRLKALLLEEAQRILEEDRATCRKIGENGAKLLEDGWTVLTHCNAGSLATADYGTALGVIYTARSQGKRIKVYVDETRPLLQGARLTAWELKQAGVEATLICDSAAAQVMQKRKVDCVLVGADRIAANGDVANKVGTYGLAMLAREHRIPFYVAAPVSTLDLSLGSGAEIPIEERSPEEVTEGFGQRTAPEGVRVYNPAFDITPARLITAIITENGTARPPYEFSLRALVGKRG